MIGTEMTRTEVFWSRVNKTDDCWEWTAGGSGGRGIMTWNGRSTLAYRISWELEHGDPPPSDLHVCHHCDNPACVRPSHLFLGTDLDNLRDMFAKGRNPGPPNLYGLDNPKATAPDEVVRQCREDRAAGATRGEIAARHGVSIGMVDNWIYGRCRREAGGPMPPARVRADRA